MQSRIRTQKIATLGLFLAFALVLSYVESLIPFAFAVPGMKLGLANCAIVMLLYKEGYKEAVLVNVLRVILAGFLFGNLYSILYSLAGALLSFVVMFLLWKMRKFSIMGVSIGGGVFHNIGQLIVAAVVLQTLNLAYYLPILLIAGIGTGFLNGLIAGKVLPYLPKYLEDIK